MSKRIRINAKFGDTKLLVPCGEGDITVEELIEKAIGRFKKHKKLHENDQIIVQDIFQADGSACDRDDDVIDLLDDKETVTFVYKLIPHDAPPGYQPVLVGATEPPNDADLLISLDSNVPPSLDGPPTLLNGSINTSINGPPPPPIAPSLTLNGPIPNGSYQSLPPTDYTPSKQMYTSPVPVYNDNNEYSRDFLSTPTNLFSSSSRDNLLDDVPVGANNSSGCALPSDDFRPSAVSKHSQLIDEEEELSQVGMETMDDGFSQDMSSSHPHSQVGHSQISLHSQDSHKYSSSNTPNYELPSGGGGGGGEREHGDISGVNNYQNMGAQLGNSSSKSMTVLDSSKNNRLSFTTSQSMERLDLYQPHPQQQQQQHQMRNQSFSSSQQQFQDSGYLSYNNRSYHQQQLGPALSQDYPAVHSQQDYYFPPDGGAGGSGGYMMTQPVGNVWNTRLYAAQMQQRYRHPYSHMGPHPQRPQYPPMTGRDPYDRHPESDYYYGGGYSPYPPHHPPQYNDYNDRRTKRSSISSEYDDHMISGGRGIRYNVPRGWGNKGNYDDDYNTNQQHQREEDPSLECHLSQPATSYSGGRHSHHLATPPVHIGRSSSMSGPSGYSLSQPGGSYDRHKIKSALKNRNEQSPRSDIRSKHGDNPTSTHGYPIDEELFEEEDFDENKPSPFKRSASKSMILDSRWGRWEDIMSNMNLPEEYECQVPVYNDDEIDKSQGKEDNKEEKEEMNDLGNVHIVELLRGDEPLGIKLVSYTAEGRDLGVFVGVLDPDGFASKSGNLKISDRILACNGEDFTQESNQRVEERFREMAEKEPLLRMAISRGLMLDLNPSKNNNDDTNRTDNNNTATTVNSSASATTIGNKSHPTGETASPPTAAASTMSNVFTNTRQIGVKHVISISRSAKGTFGFGLSSRDVATNDDHPIYIKTISSTGPAFQDGRLKIGDRILEVNDVSVKGMTQQEVVNLLRLSGDTVKLVISRQEVVETQDEYSDSSETNTVVSSVGKSVMVLDIHLDNGLAGLGVTVHGRCSSKKHSTGDMGIYIKSIVPGGAAARDGRLQVHDQLLAVNDQSVINMSNSAAMDALKKALNHSEPNKVSNIQLTIARTASSSSTNRKHNLGLTSFSSQMPALKEEERVAPDGEQTNEIGIDCPTDDLKLSQMLSQELDLGENFDNHPPVHEDLMLSRSSNGSQGSVGRFDSSLELYTSTTATHKQGDSPRINRPPTEYNSSSLKKSGNSSPHISSSRQKDKSYSASSLPRNDYSYRDNYVDHMTGGAKGVSSNESMSRKKRQNSPPKRQESLSPTSEHSPWGATTNPHHHHSRQSPNNFSSYTRSASFNSELSSHSQPIHYAHHQSHHSLNPIQFEHSYSSSSSGSTFQHGSRGNSFRRKASPPYDTLERSPVPGRERYNTGDSSTLPRMSGATAGGGKYTVNEQDPRSEDATSLVSFSSDSELNIAFQRDHIARKSIPKNKNTPQPKLGQFQLANVVPMMEGEGSPSPPLLRTGSDTDITTVLAHTRYPDMLQDVPVGPHLRLAKSSSLESLQTVMHYTINADVHHSVGGPLRSRGSTRHSFRRAVDRSYAQEHEDSKEASTHSEPNKDSKKKSRKSLLTFLRPRKNSKSKKKDKRRSRAMSTAEFDFSEDSIDKLAKDFGISVDTIRRMQSHSGKIEGDESKDELDERSRIEERSLRDERIKDHHLYSHHNSRAL